MSLASLHRIMALTLKRVVERQFKEPHRQDPYRSKSKSHGNPQCPNCQAIQLKGRWHRLDDAVNSIEVTEKKTCPACLQAKERYAQGVVEIHGEAWKARKTLVQETILNTEKIARNRNDQQRILWERNHRNVLKYYVTLPDLARQIGRVLGRTFKGKLEFHRSSEEPYLRVIWYSDARPTASPSNRNPDRNSRQWRKRGARVSAGQGSDALASKGKRKP